MKLISVNLLLYLTYVGFILFVGLNFISEIVDLHLPVVIYPAEVVLIVWTLEMFGKWEKGSENTVDLVIFIPN